MASSDVRDILDVKPAEPRPHKKHKPTIKRPDNISKEVFGLLGERAPPVVIQAQKYQKRPKFARKAQPWEWQAFTSQGRTDGLVLHHWKQKTGAPPGTPGAPATPADVRSDNGLDGTSAQPQRTDNGWWSRYSTKVSVSEYTVEQYSANLESDDWTKEETDYLVGLVGDFDLRWMVIADRYDYRPTAGHCEGGATAETITPKTRSMEDMKARYYDVAAKMMVIHHPLSSMSTAEFDLHEKMTKFDAARETTRKRLAEALLSRNPDEIREEEILIGELKRIVANEDRFLQERKELYDRLESPPSKGSIAMYESSQGLVQLMQNLLTADKNKKRRSLMGPGDSAPSPAQGAVAQSAPGQTPRDHRGSVSSAHVKKGSVSLSSNHRQLTPREAIKFGVTYHERLSSGVSFRHQRIEKLVLAKSVSQSAKVHEALVELGTPVRAVMPTRRVCESYERLVGGIHALLDVRKVSEKVENEIRVGKAQKDAKEKRARGEVVEGEERADEDDEDEGEEGEDAEAVEAEDGNAAKDDDDDEDRENDDDDENENGEGQDEEPHVDAEMQSEDEGDGEIDGDNRNVEAEAEEEEEESEEGNDDDDDDDESGHGEDEGERGGGGRGGKGEGAREEDQRNEGDDDDDDDDRVSVAPSARSAGTRKRSASVTSAEGQKDAKRQKKSQR